MADPVLLPCPFCGGPGAFVKEQGASLWSVECHGIAQDCVAYIMPAEYARKTDAADAWNRRTVFRPTATHITLTEGGEWIPFDVISTTTVHAIAFNDGSIWDTVNGWRPSSASHPTFKPKENE